MPGLRHTGTGLRVRKSVQLGSDARPTCPCLGVLCFLCAVIASLVGAKSASADPPPKLIQVTSFAAPATVLGVTNPYLVAAAMQSSEVLRFGFSRNIRDAAHRLEKLARFGVDLNQRGAQLRDEKLQLRIQSQLSGGVLQICYRR